MNENLKFTFITMICITAIVVQIDKINSGEAKFFHYFPYIAILALSCTSMYGV